MSKKIYEVIQEIVRSEELEYYKKLELLNYIKKLAIKESNFQVYGAVENAIGEVKYKKDLEDDLSLLKN